MKILKFDKLKNFQEHVKVLVKIDIKGADWGYQKDLGPTQIWTMNLEIARPMR